MRIPSNKIADVIRFFKEELRDVYSKDEIQGFIFLSFEHFLGFTRSDVLLRQKETVTESELLKFNFLIKDLKKHKPIQYILGETEFYGLKIKVGPGVLIPRPETEELVDLIIKENIARKPLTVLDVGTGSGCIAISIKKYLPEAEVFAFDVSKDALEIAEKNADLNKVVIDFIQVNILNHQNYPNLPQLDIIVSNPPYVLDSEKEVMEANVVDHEPHLALFVKDNDPFLFYKAIAGFGKGYLKNDGKLYFEINEKYNEEIIEVVEKVGYINCKVIKDLNGKNRFLKAENG